MGQKICIQGMIQHLQVAKHMIVKTLSHDLLIQTTELIIIPTLHASYNSKDQILKGIGLTDTHYDIENR